MSFLLAIFAMTIIPLESPDTLVVCPQDFQAALQPWIEYRESQGHRISVITPPKSSYEIKQAVTKAAAGGSLKNVLLVGDSGDANGLASRLVPTDYVKAKVNVKFGSEPEIATDNTYADLNNDGLPELAIGRLPIDTPEQLSHLVNRIKEYESAKSNGFWQNRINFVAGVGGFGQMVDKVIEQTTKQLITDLIPPEYETSMTYGSWTSPYCPDPRRFSETSLQRFNEGCMFWVYIGHGARHRLDKIYLPDQSHRILTCETAHKLNCPSGSPIAIFLACYTGATDDKKDCMAEQMLIQPRGPIALICGTRVTMPYAMGVLSLEMLNEYFEGTAPTLGELIRVSKERMMGEVDTNNKYRNMLEGMGKAFSPRADLLTEERQEHVNLMHLIGDPLLRLKRPAKLSVSVSPTATQGERVQVTGVVPFSGQLVVELTYPRDRFRFRPPRRKEYDSSEASFAQYQATYEQSKQLVCERKVVTVEAGEFSLDLDMQTDANGKCVVRALLQGESQLAMGAAPIKITKSTTVREAEKTQLRK